VFPNLSFIGRCIVKYWAKIAALLLSVSALMVSAQSASNVQDHVEETQIRGYWIDPSTGLMWAGKDNGKDVSWNKAIKYCRDLRLAGYSDWRLATIGELEGVYDKGRQCSRRAALVQVDLSPFT
jgi:hypothetical protein